MAEPKELESQEYRDFLYIEETTSNDERSERLNNISMSQTVEQLKRSIAVAQGYRSDWRSLELAYGGTRLSDDDRTLASYGLQDGETVFFARDATRQTPSSAPPPYSSSPDAGISLNNVMFKDLDGKTLNLHQIPLSWTVAELRDKLGNEKNLSDIVESFRFIWNGKQFEDKNTLEFYGLRDNCTINILLRLRGGKGA